MGMTRRQQVRSRLTRELGKDRAYLLPLRVFIGLGWLRAAVEKIVDPGWYDGTELTAFLQQQLGWSQEAFPFYGTLMESVFLPGASVLGIIVILAQVFAGLAILFGAYTNAGLLVGLVMNVNFVLAGTVDPSTFYIVIQLVLFFGGAGAVLSVDAIRAKGTHSPLLTAPTAVDGERVQHQRVYGFIAAVCLVFAVAMIPYVSTLAPATVVEDPAMILVVLALFGAGASATSVVGSRDQPPSPSPRAPRAGHRLPGWRPDVRAGLTRQVRWRGRPSAAGLPATANDAFISIDQLLRGVDIGSAGRTPGRSSLITAIGRLTLLVDDQEAALGWYREVLGFEVLHDSTADGYRYLHIGVPGQDTVGLWLMPAGTGGAGVGEQTHGEPLLVLHTDDLDQVVGHLRRHDVEVWDVRDDGDSRSLHLRDLLGNVIVVAELRGTVAR